MPSSLIVLAAYALGQPALIGSTRNGQPQELSCFLKRPANINGGLFINHGGLAGDYHVDQRPTGSGGDLAHGGLKKAFYFFPAEHYAAWHTQSGQYFLRGDFNRAQGHGAPANKYEPVGQDLAYFGENLRTLGLLENDVRIGDIWQWENASLRVTAPRLPGHKLELARGPLARDWMRSTGRCGWYMELLDSPGHVSVRGELELVEAGHAPTIAEAFHAKMQQELETPASRSVH